MEQQFEGGQTGGEEERRARKAAARMLLASFERATKPVRDVLERLKGVAPPDYGPLLAPPPPLFPRHLIVLLL